MTQKKRKADRPIRDHEANGAAPAESPLEAPSHDQRVKARPAKRGVGSPTRTTDRAEPPAKTVPLLELPALDPDMFLNRELSWLDFNQRVLEEAQEATNPLLERVKFAAIFADNLDGFFMIRVAGLKRKLTTGINDPGPDGRTPIAQFAAVRRAVEEQLAAQATLVCDELLPALAAAGIEVVNYERLTASEQLALGDYFEREIFPVLTPQAVDRERRFPHVSNQSLNLIVTLRLTESGGRFARVKIPGPLPRLVPVPTATEGVPTARFIWLEQLISAHLARLFPGNEVVSAYPFHVLRDADIEPEDDDDAPDFLVTMRATLTQRTFGAVVRLMIDQTLPEDARAWLVEQLRVSERDLYVIGGPLALEGLFDLTGLDRPDLKDPPFVGATLAMPPGPVWGEAVRSRDAPPVPDIFAMLRDRDILVHHPYQSFDAVVDFVRAASSDPDVVAIKQTLYRIGKDSPLIPALVEARDDDTQVAVLVELKARFDEENNITWAQQLEQRGVHVAYGLAGLKTHCKATLVVRREKDGLRRYVHLATGNYNAGTARVYEDLGLLSAREDLGSDVSELFNVLTGYAQQDAYRTLWVAPGRLRARFLEAIAAEVAAHQRDGGGRLIFKMNSLQDPELVRALYAAARAGVRIDLIVRGICCLRPGVPGWSETVRVISVVGRFLEHSRVYWFGHGGQDGGDRLYLGSADLMQRNLDRRVEVIFPVEDPALRARVRDVVLPGYLRDTTNARELHADGTWTRVRPAAGEEPFDVQGWLLKQH